MALKSDFYSYQTPLSGLHVKGAKNGRGKNIYNNLPQRTKTAKGNRKKKIFFVPAAKPTGQRTQGVVLVADLVETKFDFTKWTFLGGACTFGACVPQNGTSAV